MTFNRFFFFKKKARVKYLKIFLDKTWPFLPEEFAMIQKLSKELEVWEVRGWGRAGQLN